ncbi:LysE family translocator [Pseudomonas wadenswilerensis]|uniref:LysE family translocator n=1 Tax=Pseudomonas wadenswilerensis TaxID=1785161 RepID=UPI00215E874C|nr:LysE family translocator [Pseudomonas wadenswilerensis]UVM20121.1 LysE family translocator [Pseudomonas wadenswilerensis]
MADDDDDQLCAARLRMMLASTLLTYFLTCAVAAATPGPGTISVITYSAFLGWRRTLPVILGIQVGMLAMAGLALSGVAAVLISSPLLFVTLQLVGALYIAYLGASSIRYARQGVEIIAQHDDSGNWRNFRHGAVVTFASPKTLLFFTSFFPVFIDPTKSALSQMLLLLALLLLITLLVHLVYAYFMKYLKDILVRYSYTFNVVVGVTFISLAVYMGVQSLK